MCVDSLLFTVVVRHVARNEEARAVKLARPHQIVEVLLEFVGVRPGEVELDLQCNNYLL